MLIFLQKILRCKPPHFGRRTSWVNLFCSHESFNYHPMGFDVVESLVIWWLDTRESTHAALDDPHAVAPRASYA